MKIKKFNELITEGRIQKILYHGSPYTFKDFKNTVTFFSETERFAVDYSDQKSFDYAMDEEPNVYKVQVNCDIFDINNKSDYNKIEKELPNEIEYTYNNFGFSAKVNKKDFLLNMTGFYILEPMEEAINAKIGDEIPNPEYRSESYIVYDKDSDFAYTYFETTFNRILEAMFSDKSDLSSDSRKYCDLFDEIRNFVTNYIKTHSKETYIHSNLRKMYAYKFFNTGKDWYGIPDIDKADLDKFAELYKKAKEDLKNKLVEEGRIKKFNLKPLKLELIDTWRYYENETVYNAIVKLGYGGYVAKEGKTNTYAIFNPKDDVKILLYEFPSGREFDSWEDWRAYNEYDRYIGTNIPKDKISNLYKYDRWNIYNAYKNGVSKEEELKKIIGE